jgi:hypothetical protein
MRALSSVHNNAVKLVLVQLSNLGVYAARREVGMFYDPRDVRALKEALTRGGPAPTLHPHKIGVDGEADIQGLIPPMGRGLAVEVKVGKDRLRPQQAQWAKMWVAGGGVHLVIHPDHSDWTLRLADVIAECRRV